ncbi:ComEA family DNA-binding protein [Nakamurella flavida]|uniref:ComEA family DNA-binding protein n=1 Tax=Nakamurella flavida TaxID=363630 RepID=A0A938YLW8_9ACTN|nr:ComEA family DNA-binding protein [Nakamurella flavida]MBM9477108.1 ComEA family DNA-binding protein [Nakamurella flavida]MDP9780054.1 competence protein ComEA [Nakamurella flavida]
MPEPIREARVDPGRRGAVVFVSVALVAGVVAAVAVWTGGPTPQPVAATVLAPVTDPGSASSGDVAPTGAHTGAGPAPTAPGGVASGSSAASGSPADPAPAAPVPVPVPVEVVVSVTGRVVAPGLVTLPPGSRVADAVAAAGGPTAEADLTGLNLAARLADGDSVVIGSAAEPAPAGVSRVAPGSAPSSVGAAGAVGAAGGGTGLLDLNSADQAALEDLPGVGPVMAQAILAWRTEHGPFTDVGQLQEVSGIGPARYAQLQPLVTV